MFFNFQIEVVCYVTWLYFFIKTKKILCSSEAVTPHPPQNTNKWILLFVPCKRHFLCGSIHTYSCSRSRWPIRCWPRPPAVIDQPINRWHLSSHLWETKLLVRSVMRCDDDRGHK